MVSYRTDRLVTYLFPCGLKGETRMRATRPSKLTSQHVGRVLLAALVLATSLTLPATAHARPATLEDKLNRARNVMLKTSSRVAEARKKREHILLVMEIASENYNKANDEYQKARSRLEDIERQLANTGERLTHFEKLLTIRVKGIYRNGTPDVMAWVLEATDFSDLVGRLRMLSLIAEQDARMVKTIREIRERLGDLERAQKVETTKAEREKNRREEYRSEVEAREAEYKAEIARLKAYYDRLAKNEAKLSVAYARQVARERAAALGNESGWIPPPGWVPPPGGRPEAVTLAMKEIGKPYVWGAEGPDSFDCSGLMLYVYRQLGIEIPRVSRDQYWAGMRVTRTQLLPGDLVFFSYSGSPSGIHHVGMYIGSGKFIHAPHSGDVVKISDLDTRSGFVGGTRI